MNSVTTNEHLLHLPSYVSKESNKDVSKYMNYIILERDKKINIKNYNIIVCGDIGNKVRNEITEKIYNVLLNNNLISDEYIYLYNTDKKIHIIKNKLCIIDFSSFYIRYLEEIVAELTSNNNICLIFSNKDKTNPQLKNVYWKCDINIDKCKYIKNEITENGFKIARNSKFIKDLATKPINDIDRKLVNVYTSLLQKNRKTINDNYFEIGDTTNIKENGKKKEMKSNTSKGLNDVVGLNNAKEQINDIVNFISVCKKRKQQMPSLHMCFMGNPGTGKTTIARLVGKLFSEKKILSDKKFTEVSRQDLIGEYVGETAVKTENILKKALGGVLFIDEAYSLYDEYYGKECIATIIKFMEDHRDNICIIFAGYKEDMENMLLKANVGLESRIPFKIEFEDYSPEELYLIFLKMVHKDKYRLPRRFENTFIQYIETKCKVEHFSNGRFVRNLYEKTIMEQAKRVSKEKGDMNLITIEDFEKATLKVVELGIDNRKRKIGF